MRGWFAPTLNLENLDPRCGELDYIVGDGRGSTPSYVMNNNFAFGGVNTSMIFRRAGALSVSTPAVAGCRPIRSGPCLCRTAARCPAREFMRDVRGDRAARCH